MTVDQTPDALTVVVVENLRQQRRGKILVADGAQEAATAYLLFRRTLRDPGKTVLGEPPSHMEFLIDRFGYVRARWLPQDEEGTGEGWRDTQFLLDQIERINREPKILPPPDDHVH